VRVHARARRVRIGVADLRALTRRQSGRKILGYGVRVNRYQQGKAKVTLTPCMNLEDLEKGFEELGSQMASTEGT